jgi:hypothetical protein
MLFKRTIHLHVNVCNRWVQKMRNIIDNMRFVMFNINWCLQTRFSGLEYKKKD